MSHNYVRYEELAAVQLASDGAPPRRCCGGLRRALGWLFGSGAHEHRTIKLNAKRPTARRHCRNVINNQKFSLLTFFPKVLYEQFKFFFNLYFLVVAVSQFFPPLKVGFLFTYIAPLGFVLAITMVKEAHDDIQRFLSDRKLNGETYERLCAGGKVERVPSSAIRVGDLIAIRTNQRVPADVVLLRTTEHSGTVFLRTDQLDGETDWKLRVAVPSCQRLESDGALQGLQATLYAAAPSRDIYEFVGELATPAEPGAPDGGAGAAGPSPPLAEPLGLEHTMWCNTVLASGTAIGAVVYTGDEVRPLARGRGIGARAARHHARLTRCAPPRLLPLCCTDALHDERVRHPDQGERARFADQLPGQDPLLLHHLPRGRHGAAAARPLALAAA